MNKVVNLHNVRTRQQHAELITKAWGEQLSNIFETGLRLETAKAELGKGQWIPMVKEDLPFNRQTADKLIKIGECENLRNVSPGRHLPVNWTILYELTKLSDEQFAEGIKSGAINSKMHRKDVATLRGVEPKKKEPREPRVPTIKNSSWKNNGRYIAIIRSMITECWEDVPGERATLFAELRSDIDHLEGQLNGHNTEN